MSSGDGAYRLIPPASAEEWDTYHSIRRQVLFERRGQFGLYDEHHPDDRAPSHHALLLFHDDLPIGVIRIDLEEGIAIFRRVAIREDHQRQGHGRALLRLAEEHAASHGTRELRSFVAPDAVEFYEHCGFSRGPHQGSDPTHVPMHKAI
jgi:GNAT superfamily N-acetyltransferase